MSKTHYYRLSDGTPIDEDEARDENGILRDGVHMRVPMMMRDGAGNVLVDGLGNPLPAEGRRSGFVFTDNSSSQRAAEHVSFQKAELSARWRGGLAQGDHVKMGDRNMEVVGYNDTNGKVVLSDTSTLDADELKQDALDAYERDVTTAWKTRDADLAGGACTTPEGSHGYWTKGKDGNLVCKPHSQAEPGQNEWDISGPLSDSEIAEIKHDAWLESVEALQNAWRR